MIDRNTMIEDPAVATTEPPSDGPEHAMEPLEQRVHRLEDAVAALQDTALMEERITERVVGRMNRKAAADGLALMDAECRTTASSSPAAPPADAAAASPPPVTSKPSSWVITEVFREIRTLFAMFFDPRYHVSWSAMLALMLVAYVLVSHWLWTLWAFVPIVGVLSGPMAWPFVGPLLDKTLGLIIALFAYKILSREMVRYREALARQSSHQPY
jgi:hypothetical protein